MFTSYHRVSTAFYPRLAEKRPNAIKFGILGAANIAPSSLIIPAKSHPDVVVYAIAARDRSKAEAFARKHGVEKVHDGYQQLLDDPAVDAVFNPLPNGLHYEWTMKALTAGKHVLLEKPAADTAEEVRKMFDFAEEKGLVLLEAFHYRFHPAIQRVKEILDSGELGALKSIEASIGTPGIFFPSSDIRFNYDLGGGAMMDMGCYTLNVIRYLSASEPTSVLEATATPLSSTHPGTLIDTTTSATVALPTPTSTTPASSITPKGSLLCSLALPPLWWFIPRMPRLHAAVRCESGDVELYNFIMPTVYHRIKVRRKTTQNGREKVEERVETAYGFKEGKGVGEDWWTTYRYQLAAFIDKIRGTEPQTWISKEDSVGNAHWIEEIYKKTGLGSRPASSFTL